MLRQADNSVKIEGVLAEVDIKQSQFTYDGQVKDAIGGKILVKVNQKIGGKPMELMVPVYCFATKYTKKGTLNPAWESINRLMTEFVSIAAAGGEEKADRIRIPKGDIRMNEYYSPDGKLISYPRIHASFFNKIKKEDCNSEASFILQFAVASMSDETDRNGEPTGRTVVKALVPQYGGKVDVIPLIAASPNVVDAITTYWEVGDTVKANGRINFSSMTEIVYEEVDFGEPVEKVRTVNVSDLILTGGSQTPLEGEFAFEKADLDAALAERKARLEGKRDKDMSATSSRKTPLQKPKAGFDDLGF